jgi:hypothetical protein
MVDEYESWKEAKLESTGEARLDDWNDYKRIIGGLGAVLR